MKTTDYGHTPHFHITNCTDSFFSCNACHICDKIMQKCLSRHRLRITAIFPPTFIPSPFGEKHLRALVCSKLAYLRVVLCSSIGRHAPIWNQLTVDLHQQAKSYRIRYTTSRNDVTLYNERNAKIDGHFHKTLSSPINYRLLIQTTHLTFKYELNPRELYLKRGAWNRNCPYNFRIRPCRIVGDKFSLPLWRENRCRPFEHSTGYAKVQRSRKRRSML